MAAVKAIVLEWDRGGRVYRWVRGHDLPMEYSDAEHAATSLQDHHGGHFIPVPVHALEGKRIV